MRQLLLIVFLYGALCQAQEDDPTVPRKRDNILLTGGIHIGFVKVENYEKVPFNFQLDKVFSNRVALGVGYSFDHFFVDPRNSIFNFRPAAIRHNLRLRFYGLTADPTRPMSLFFGGSMGMSDWRERLDGPSVDQRLSGQIFFGMRVNLSEYAVWLMELSAGAPYAAMTSVGFWF